MVRVALLPFAHRHAVVRAEAFPEQDSAAPPMIERAYQAATSGCRQEIAA